MFNKVRRDWQNGENDGMMLNTALVIFRQEKNKHFRYVDFWQVVKWCAT